MTKITAPGVYDAIPFVDYINDPCVRPSLSSSGLRQLLECPAKFWWNSPLNPDREPEGMKDEYSIGHAAHDLILFDKDELEERFHVLSEGCNLRTNAGKAERDLALEAGKTVIRFEDYLLACRMRDAVARHEYIWAAFKGGKAEQTLVWEDKETGVWLRARPDFLPDMLSIIPDYKTAASAEPETFRRQCFNLGYYIQAELYLQGIAAVTDSKPRGFMFVVQEKDPPFVVQPYALASNAREWAQIQITAGIQRFARCLEKDDWPGYAPDVLEVDVPGWGENNLERRHAAGAFDPYQEEAA